ncbi:zinc finger protein 583-like isoform X1 [Anastrepha obliqua]|uniref:zinc finger protein 583-like isoform X1 n=1 Tax=Anastrepha obliqua TaxID=95512 RepID=UPI00240A7C76|nr:zinc finger protein 583-like isoform X1 [Anastrepha obliqua]
MTDSVHKCGDVMRAGERDYSLSCVYCGDRFSTLEKFANHVEDEHLSRGSNQEYLELKIIEELSDDTEEAKPEERNVFINIEVLDDIEETEEVNETREEKTELRENVMELECDENEEYLYASRVDDEGGYEETELDLSDTDEESSSDSLKMFDKETIATIFLHFENHSILWDRDDPTSKNLALRSVAYKSIASDVGKLDQWKKVRDVVRKLNHRLRQELDRKRNYLSLGMSYTPLWIEDMDTFLQIKKESKKYAAPKTVLSDSQFRTFIKIYKSLTCLWNDVHIDYRLPNKRQEALIEFEKLLRNLGISLTQSQIEQEIARTRKICWQEKKRKLKCEEMKISYVPEYAYYDQIKFLETDVGPFRCGKCKEILPGLNTFKVHKSKHDGIKPFTCPLCGNGFTTVHNLNIHINRHTGDYKYICKYCEKGFPALSEQIIHERSHTGERPYFCDQCGKTFRAWAYYDSHIRRHQNRPGYECSVCFKKFFGAYQLNEHMRVHRKERDQVCNVCGKGFKMAKYLRQHKQIHSVKKKYMCKICDKAFAQYAGLSGHMKSHGTTLVGNNNRINTTADDKQD